MFKKPQDNHWPPLDVRDLHNKKKDPAGSTVPGKFSTMAAALRGVAVVVKKKR